MTKNPYKSARCAGRISSLSRKESNALRRQSHKRVRRHGKQEIARGNQQG